MIDERLEAELQPRCEIVTTARRGRILGNGYYVQGLVVMPCPDPACWIVTDTGHDSGKRTLVCNRHSMIAREANGHGYLCPKCGTIIEFAVTALNQPPAGAPAIETIE